MCCGGCTVVAALAGLDGDYFAEYWVSSQLKCNRLFDGELTEAWLWPHLHYWQLVLPSNHINALSRVWIVDSWETNCKTLFSAIFLRTDFHLQHHKNFKPHLSIRICGVFTSCSINSRHEIDHPTDLKNPLCKH